MLDWNGDTIRYAGDILDYMVIANLLTVYNNNYYINWDEKEAIFAFIESSSWFDKYDSLYKTNFDASNLSSYESLWFEYVNKDLGGSLLKQIFSNILELKKMLIKILKV